MKDSIYVFGTSHQYQRPGDLPQEKIARFKAAIKQVCLVKGIRSISEENNLEAQKEHGKGQSLPYWISKELEIHHDYCDPDRKTRIEAGYWQENDIRAHHLLDDVSEDFIASEVEKSLKSRERYWLARITSAKKFPVLLICGANHVSSVVDQAHEQGFVVSISHEDWSA